MNLNKKIYIFGAGISGLTSAYYLAEKGYNNIEIFESTKFAGGRCRSFYEKALDTEIDNGNHLILKSNKNLINLINHLGTRDRFLESKTPEINIYDHKSKESYAFDFDVGLNPKEYLNFSTQMLFNKNSQTVEEALKKCPELYSQFFDLASRSILNTNSKEADWKILRNVFIKIFKNSFPNIKDGFNYLTPKTNWNEVLIEPLLKYLEKKGVKINYSEGLKDIKIENRTITKIKTSKQSLNTKESKLIFALPASVIDKFFDIPTPQKFNAIMNIHFKNDFKLEPQIIAINNSIIDWVFIKENTISTTSSDFKNDKNISNEELGEKVKEIIEETLLKKELINKTEDLNLEHHKVIIEKRATFSCDSKTLANRPNQDSLNLKNSTLTGDYIDNGLPSTLEGCLVNSINLLKKFKEI